MRRGRGGELSRRDKRGWPGPPLDAPHSWETGRRGRRPLRKGCGRVGVGALHEAPAQNFRFAGGRIVMRPYNGGHDKSWPYARSALRRGTTCRARRFALRRLRDARLPFVSGHKQPGYARLGLYPSLRSIRAAPHASALLFTLRHARGRVAKSCDYADKHPGLRPSLVCRHPLRT